jgi:hypothetical protein
MREDLLNDPAFPTLANPGHPEKIVFRSHAEKSVQESAVTPVNLGRADKSLGDFGMIGRQSADQEGTFHVVQV